MKRTMSEAERVFRENYRKAENEIRLLTEPDFTGMSEEEKQVATANFKNKKTEILKKYNAL